MTAAEFAVLVDGRAVGRNRFQARCPAHNDRLPSLSITDGRDGRILLHCFAGCTTDAILSVLRLSRRDLFQGPPPSPEQLAALEVERKATEQRKRAARAAEREAWDKACRWEAVVSALGGKLARTSEEALEGDALTRTFHDACARWADAEAAAIKESEARAAA